AAAEEIDAAGAPGVAGDGGVLDRQQAHGPARDVDPPAAKGRPGVPGDDRVLDRQVGLNAPGNAAATAEDARLNPPAADREAVEGHVDGGIVDRKDAEVIRGGAAPPDGQVGGPCGVGDGQVAVADGGQRGEQVDHLRPGGQVELDVVV